MSDINDAGLLYRTAGEIGECGGIGVTPENQHDAHARRDSRLERVELGTGRGQIVLIDGGRGVAQIGDAMRARIEEQAREDKILGAGIINVERTVSRTSGSGKEN
jgi:hypothetical protein